MNPIANFQLVFTNSSHQPYTPKQPRFFRVKDSIREILPEIELAPKNPQTFFFFFDWLGFRVRPSHPWFEMLDAVGVRIPLHLDVRWLITSHDQSRGFNAIGGVRESGVAHSFFAARFFDAGFLPKPVNSELNSFSSPTCPLKYSFMNCERRNLNAIGATVLRSSTLTSARSSAAA